MISTNVMFCADADHIWFVELMYIVALYNKQCDPSTALYHHI